MNRVSKAIAGISTGLVLSMTIVGTAVADKERGHHGGMGFGHPRGMERMAQALDLTSTQREQVSAIMQSHGPELRSIHERIREQRRALAAAGSNGFDENAARAEAEVLGDLVAQAAVLMTRARADINEVLTAEQREKMEQFQRRAPRPHGSRARSNG